jgi:hypothetical protein
MAKGYTDAAQVALYLGLALTDAQDAAAAALVDAAESWVDSYTGRAWLTGAVAGEVHTEPGVLVQLRQWPITSVEAVTVVRQRHWAAVATPLNAATDYQVREARRGVLWVTPWRVADYLTVDYTPEATLPAAIGQATTALVAGWLRPALQGVGSDVKSFSAFGQVSMAFRDEPVPPAVTALLAPYTALVFA